MSGPKFTASFVFHFMKPEEPIKPYHNHAGDYEELTGGFEHDRGYEQYGTSYDDDRESVVEAALGTIFEDPLVDKLEDGDYVSIMLAGTMQYSVYEHWEGGTECDLTVYPEWYALRVLDAGERRNCDRMNDIRPDVPLALYTEVDWEHPFVFPNQPIHLFAPLKFT